MSYAPLSRARRGLVRYDWYTAADHLLLVRRAVWAVSYHRIRLDDIQGMVVSASNRNYVRAATWTGVAAVFALPFLTGGRAAGATLLALGAALGLLELARGPFGETRIQTPTSQLHYPFANRLRSNQQVARRVQALVEPSQGAWTPPVPVELPPAPVAPAAIAAAAQTPTYAPRRWSVTVWLTTALLALAGALPLAGLNFRSPLVPVLASSGLLLASFSLAIVAAILVWRHPCQPGVRVLAMVNVLWYPCVLGTGLGLAVGLAASGFFQTTATAPAVFGARFGIVFCIVQLFLALFEAAWFLIVGGHFLRPQPASATIALTVSEP